MCEPSLHSYSKAVTFIFDTKCPADSAYQDPVKIPVIYREGTNTTKHVETWIQAWLDCQWSTSKSVGQKAFDILSLEALHILYVFKVFTDIVTPVGTSVNVLRDTSAEAGLHASETAGKI